MKKIILVLGLICYSSVSMAQTNVFGSFWDNLKLFLGFNLARTVNQAVLPPQSGCSPGTLSHPPREESYPDDEFPLAGIVPQVEEEIIEEKPKSVRDILKENYSKLGGDPIALSQALCFYDTNQNTNFKAAGDPSRSTGIKIDNKRYITINDMNKSYFQSRFHVLDLETGKVKAYYSAHGIGGKKGVAESGSMAEEFSNIDGSNASPRGFFITGSRRNGSSDPKQRWTFSMKLHGLQSGVNDRSFARAVVMHSFPDVSNEVATSDDEKPKLKNDPYPFYLSQGCPMIGPQVADEIIDTIKAPNNNTGGSLYYNYSPHEKARGEDYCGDEGLLKK